MKTTRSLFVSVFLLVVLAAAAVPTVRFFNASLQNTSAAGAALPAASQPLTSIDRYGHNLTGELIPGKLKAPTSFIGNKVPYQAEAWLKQDTQTRTGFIGNKVPYQAEAWLKQDAQTPTGFIGNKVPYQAEAWLKQAAQTPARQSMSSLDHYGHNLTGGMIPGQLKARSGFYGDKVPYQAKPWVEQDALRKADDSSSLNLTGTLISMSLIGEPEPRDNNVLPVEPPVTF
jgi:hypothetical protein